MKKIIFPLLLTLSALTPPAFAGFDQCKDARDFQGCMSVMDSKHTIDGLTPLRQALKQVAARLRAGTSLRDSTITFQPVVDALALVADTHADTDTVRNAQKAYRLFEAYQFAWQTRIDAIAHSMNEYATGGESFYGCEMLKVSADNFDKVLGRPAIRWNYKKGLFGMTICRVKPHQLPEAYMRPIVIQALETAAIDPKVIAAQRAAEAERRRRCALGPWQRHLDAKPGLKAWAKANPQLAEAKKQKFLSNPKNQTSC